MKNRYQFNLIFLQNHQFKYQQLRPTISSGTSVTISSTPSNLNGYSWSSGQTTANITVAPTSTSEFILTVTDASGCTNKDTIEISVVQITPGTISGTTNFCEGTAPSTMTISGTTGGSNQFTYQWMSSIDGVSYSNVSGGSGATTTSYSPGPQKRHDTLQSKNFGPK